MTLPMTRCRDLSYVQIDNQVNIYIMIKIINILQKCYKHIESHQEKHFLELPDRTKRWYIVKVVPSKMLLEIFCYISVSPTYLHKLRHIRINFLLWFMDEIRIFKFKVMSAQQQCEPWKHTLGYIFKLQWFINMVGLKHYFQIKQNENTNIYNSKSNDIIWYISLLNPQLFGKCNDFNIPTVNYPFVHCQ